MQDLPPDPDPEPLTDKQTNSAAEQFLQDALKSLLICFNPPAAVNSPRAELDSLQPPHILDWSDQINAQINYSQQQMSQLPRHTDPPTHTPPPLPSQHHQGLLRIIMQTPVVFRGKEMGGVFGCCDDMCVKCLLKG